MKWFGKIGKDIWYALVSEDMMTTYAAIWTTKKYYKQGEAYIYLGAENPSPTNMHCHLIYDSVEEGIADLEKTCREMWEQD